MPKHSDWILFAQRDLKAAKIIIQHEQESISVALYLSQQCAEKALKGYLVYKKAPLRKTHDLLSLMYACADFDAKFNKLVQNAIDLNPLSTCSRYPDDFYIIPDLTTTKIFIQQAEEILAFIIDEVAWD